jgi:hypothetical protein
MKVYACHLLNSEEAAKASAAGTDVVVCNGVNPGLGDWPFQIIDANEFRIQASHRAFDANRELYEKQVACKWPAAFAFRGIELWDAYLKAVLWSNRKTAHLEEAIASLGPDARVIHRVPLHHGSRLRCAFSLAKTMLRKLRGGPFRLPELAVPQERKLGFLVDNIFGFNLIQRIYQAFPGQSVLVLPPHHTFKDNEIAALKAEGYQLVICPPATWVHIPFTLPFVFGGPTAWYVQQMLRNEQAVSSCLAWGQALMESSLRVLVTIAQENTPEGHILGRMAAREGKQVVNVMNGIKYGESNDRLVQFQCWMVWDEPLRQLLLRHTGLPKERLYIGGNLSRDNIRDHVYSGNIPVSEAERASKRIISIISTRDLRRDKVTALTTLYTWAAKQPDVILLYRPHPSEKEDSYYLPASDSGIDIRMVRPDASVAQKSLLDQLMSSDLTINFGSTVSIEALWMKARCITFEMKPASWLYCVDGQTLLHINSREGLLDALQDCRFQPKAGSVVSGDQEPYSWEKHANYIRPLIQA